VGNCPLNIKDKMKDLESYQHKLKAILTKIESLNKEKNQLTQEAIEIQGVIKYINQKEKPKNEQTPK
tara:strand:- start:56 stop:256 length:201 start_codon:yes stop_codon:yes gene_type:complete